MLSRWNRTASQLSKLYSSNHKHNLFSIQCLSKSSASAAVSPAPSHDSAGLPSPSKSPVNLDKMFWSKPRSLTIPKDSPLRVNEPDYQGIKRFFLKLMLFYSTQSKSIRGANVVYKRIVSQVDKPLIYDVFNLEKTFKMTFSLLVLHMWLVLRRLKQEGNEGVEFGQYLYEIYNHDVELRVSKAGVNLLLIKWMKELEKIFYGNIVAYDAALLPEAKSTELVKVVWKNVFSDDGSSEPDASALRAVQAMARYVRHEVDCFSLTDKEAMFSGNFMFTALENASSSDTTRR
ncbi:uncharacterized protein LOC126675332 isoform X2 [Mercurialis annua]|uniref:uncharacterized protein LOC126675332 isoform X2 n=1 Tax=Mercurialis annua TaxID=3986 RepID=UPI00215E0CCF|nr:uncharacterized protein LOC126675332 isoform X2 [Mercurialis annua]